jgi:hypothetical protein
MVSLLAVIALIGLCGADVSVNRTGDSIKAKKVSPSKTKQLEEIDGWCGTGSAPEYQEQVQRWVDDGTWSDVTQGNLADFRGTTTYVSTTFHIFRHSDGSGGLPSEFCQLNIDRVNEEVAEMGLVFCIKSIEYYNLADPRINMSDPEENPPTLGFDINSMNVYCTPLITGFTMEGEEVPAGVCGYTTGIGPPETTLVVQNDCVVWDYEQNEEESTTFCHETGHFFGLLHTFQGTEDGSNPECVNGSNCTTAGDYICDTSADDGAGSDEFCEYNGGGMDNPDDGCVGEPYFPNMDNIMSYYPEECTDTLTDEQLNVYAFTATLRPEIISDTSCVPVPGACCSEAESCVITFEDDCVNFGWNWLGQGSICEDGCDQNDPGACCVGGTNCVSIPEDNCLAGGGTWLGVNIPCEVGTCGYPEGACCISAGNCSVLTEAECNSQDGSWLGDGEACDEGVCGYPEGACCVTAGNCAVLTESVCSSIGGSWLGDGTVCDDGVCGEPCVADINGDSMVNVNDLLEVVNQWGSTSGSADINGDGIVNVSDLLEIVNSWGSCP